MDKLERLEKLKAMLDQGAISQQEYETMKAEVIANQPSMPQATAPSATYGEPEKSIRTGVGWQEVVAVLGGLIGGIVYAFATKQKAGKKAVVFGLGVLMSIISTIALGDGEKATTSSSSDTTTEQVETSTTENSAPANDPPANTDGGEVSLNSWGDVRGDRSIKVSGSEITDQLNPGNEFMEPLTADGGKLVVVYVDIKNTGNESGDMFWSQFALRDSQGRSYKEIADFDELMTISMWAEAQGLKDSGDQLFPGATANVAKVFRVAPDASGLVMVVNEDQIFAIGN